MISHGGRRSSTRCETTATQSFNRAIGKNAAREALQLHQNTWHAGPYFLTKSALFFNLELTDTNLTDHNFHRIETSIKLIMN